MISKDFRYLLYIGQYFFICKTQHLKACRFQVGCSMLILCMNLGKAMCVSIYFNDQ